MIQYIIITILFIIFFKNKIFSNNINKSNANSLESQSFYYYAKYSSFKPNNSHKIIRNKLFLMIRVEPINIPKYKSLFSRYRNCKYYILLVNMQQNKNININDIEKICVQQQEIEISQENYEKYFQMNTKRKILKTPKYSSKYKEVSFPVFIVLICFLFKYIIYHNNHKNLLVKNEANNNVIKIIFNDSCAICLEYFNNENNKKCPMHKIIIFLKCRHYFHEKCIIKWFKKHNNCPICRANLLYDSKYIILSI